MGHCRPEKGNFKLQSLSVAIAQDLHDWTLSLTASTTPVFNTTENAYHLNTAISINPRLEGPLGHEIHSHLQYLCRTTTPPTPNITTEPRSGGGARLQFSPRADKVGPGAYVDGTVGIVLEKTSALADLCGANDYNLRVMERLVGSRIFCRGNELSSTPRRRPRASSSGSSSSASSSPWPRA